MDNQKNNLKFAQIGNDVTIWPQAKIIQSEVISIGDSVIIDDFVFLVGGQKTVLGSFIHIGSFASITGGGGLIMEDFSGLSSGVRIFTGNEDYSGECLTNPTVPYPFRTPLRSFVKINKHAIIGANAVILPGVVIGEGAVVGANSLVTKDCKPWTVYFGSPAKPIRRRPSERIYSLELELRNKLYDVDGSFIPREYRSDVICSVTPEGFK
jgi:galactoside O-acetyltransferase